MFCIILQGQFFGTHALIFALKSASDAIALYSFERSFHNLGLRQEGASMLYCAAWILFEQKCEFGNFLGSKVFRSILKYH